MKLVRFGAPGREKPGIIGDDGKIRDLSRLVKDIDGAMLASGGLAKIRKANLKRMKPVSGKPRLGPCIGHVRNFIAIGLNYADHAAESGVPVPDEPVVFNKAPSCICGPNDNTMIPKGSTKLDYECELGVVIGKRARYLSKEKAMDAVAGYCISNDVSERAFQMEHGQTICKGKGAETFGPLGPWLVTGEELADPQDLAIRCYVEDELRQDARTSEMVFDCFDQVSHLSEAFTLEPGDVIATGTPAGVGLGRQPVRDNLLHVGETVRVEIEAIGELANTVVAEPDGYLAP